MGTKIGFQNMTLPPALHVSESADNDLLQLSNRTEHYGR